MEHVLATIESHVSPDAMKQGAPEGLKTGHINAGMSLYEAFAKDDEVASSALETIKALAETLTQDQFAAACKDCTKVASNTDAALGWTEPAGATGADKYGPKRKVINARMSEAKRIFGVQKMAPHVLKEKGYHAAVSAAREWLDANGKTWDGDNAKTKEQRDAQKAVRANDKAIHAALEQMPREPGQSLKDWLLNGGDELAQTIQEEQEFSDCVQALQKMGTPEKMAGAFFRYMKLFAGSPLMHSLAQQLHEEAQEQMEASLQDAPF